MSDGSRESDAVAESTRRVRRGCYASALILVALSAMLLSASQGNLFYLLLIGLALAMALFAWRVVR